MRTYFSEKKTVAGIPPHCPPDIGSYSNPCFALHTSKKYEPHTLYIKDRYFSF